MKYEDVEVNSERWLSLENLLNEEWKDVAGYEKMYEVSSYGRVKSLKRGIILKSAKDRGKYLQLVLCKDNTQKTEKVHRLVAQAFIPNPDNKPQVNHKNGIKADNRVENLEWCTNSENQLHAYNMGLKSRRYGKDNPNTILVNQYSLNGKFIKTWYGFGDIDRALNFDYRNVCACCRGKKKTAYGYIWRYEDERDIK